jgi:hypothetical protein
MRKAGHSEVPPAFEAPPTLPETMRAPKYRMAAVEPCSSNTQLAGIVERLIYAIDPVALIIGLVSRAEASKNRTAGRIAKDILGNANNEGLTTLTQVLRII